MRTRPRAVAGITLSIVSALLTFVGTPRAWALCSTIADGLQVLDPSVTLKVIREGPVNCGPQLTPWECMANSGPQLILNGAPGGYAIGVDAAGSHYNISARVSVDFFITARGFLLQRLDANGVSVDLIRMFTGVGRPDGSVDIFQYSSQIQFDVTNGKILLAAFNSTGCPGATYGLVEISGLPTLFDTLLTFVPPGQTISLLTPAHPDGFRSADALQLWAGDVASLPDWSQAQAADCHAATSPAPGQLVSLADPLPDPPVGHGRYYLTASANGLDRRLGRQYINGVFSARNPATLPVCGP